MFDLSGKVALVTGASGGLGRHFANVLSDAGASVVVAARREDKLKETVDTIQAKGGTAMAISLDVTDESRYPDCFDAIETQLGPVDILINNAGIASDPLPWNEVTSREWDQVLNANLRAVWLLSQFMCERAANSHRAASIVNISSIYGQREGLLKLPYNVSKSAVVQLTKTLAAELLAAKQPIRVNALCPGYFATDITTAISESDAGMNYIKRSPPGRMGRYEELNGPLLLLASDAGSYINGTSLTVDGGHCVKAI